jgi:hypothetical protein
VPDWAPVSDVFLDGVQLGLFVTFLAIFGLVAVAAVRRVLSL